MKTEKTLQIYKQKKKKEESPTSEKKEKKKTTVYVYKSILYTHDNIPYIHNYAVGDVADIEAVFHTHCD